MNKPTVFFSHSSHDQRPLARLKELFLAKTGGSIDVFLSSDGQSIPFGQNWVYSVEQALVQAKLMLVFVTPNSVRSNWLYFESGYAYSKGLRVVPVGLFGIDLSSIPPPLSLLQGFNVTSECGLENIIAVVNDVFGHKHSEGFSSDDFRNISNEANVGTGTQLGKHAPMVDQICLSIEKETLIDQDPINSLKAVAVYLSDVGREFEATDREIDVLGVTFFAQVGNGPGYVEIKIDPTVIDVAMSLVQQSTRIIRKDGLTGQTMRLDFVAGVEHVRERHKITGRLFGTEVKLVSGEYLRFRNLEFMLGRLRSHTMRSIQVGAAYLQVRATEDDLALPTVRDLLDLLFERELLYFGE